MLRYLTKIIDRDTGVTLSSKQFVKRIEAVNHAQQNENNNIKAMVIDLMSHYKNSISNKIIYASRPF